MAFLVFNSGSASLKFRLFDNHGELTLLAKGKASEFGSAASLEWDEQGERELVRLALRDHAEAADLILARVQHLLAQRSRSLIALGHRIVHGGARLSAPCRITRDAMTELDAASALAPLHNPPALAVIRASLARLGERVPMLAVFDTAFFHDLPDHAAAYALPAEWRERFGIKRYGFHGIAHRYLSSRYAETSGNDSARVITLQLGQGCSIAAVKDGQPLDTSMGFTPLEGLMMGTRCGDVDAGALVHIAAKTLLTPEEMLQGLSERSGLLGLSGASSHIRELLRLEAQGHAGAALALRAFCYRVRKYIGAYFAVLDGAGAIVFGGGIGEHSPAIRARICAGMEWCGLVVDEVLNAHAIGVEARISAPSSRIAVYVIPVDEEIVIARDTRNYLERER